MSSTSTKEGAGILEKMSQSFTTVAEKWYPDAFIFVTLGVIIVAVANLATGAAPMDVAKGFGNGFWTLIPFTMQMAMIVISGYIVATSRPCARLIDALARVPKTSAGAIAWICFISMVASILQWALSLILGGLLVRALARRTDIKMDYRAAGAAAYLGLGATWALGFSSSAAMLQANPASLPKSISDISGVIPLTETILLWQSIVMLLIIIIASVAVAYFSAPKGNNIRTAADMEADVSPPETIVEKPSRPGEKLEFVRILPIIIFILGVGYFVEEFSTKKAILVISSLNNYNFCFLILGLLLHGNIRNFLRALNKAVPGASGVLIQFPFYGAIATMLTAVPGSDGWTISHHIAQFFVAIANADTFPVVIGAYSAILGFFVPSGGGKWIVEAPYVFEAAVTLKTHMGWAVQVYNAAEALPNLINPFWMLPLLGVLGLKARDIVGFCFTQLLLHIPLVLFLLWLLAPPGPA